jgi:hypothetical protein
MRKLYVKGIIENTNITMRSVEMRSTDETDTVIPETTPCIQALMSVTAIHTLHVRTTFAANHTQTTQHYYQHWE